MLFVVEVKQIDGQIEGTEKSRVVVHAHPEGQTTEEIWTREIRWRKNYSSIISKYPFPPEEEVTAMGTSAGLCISADNKELGQVYGNIIKRDPDDDEVVAFGHYLFNTLLGNEAWKAIQARAPEGEPIDLALLWNDREGELTWLPWEMMCSPNGFLVTDNKRQVGICRLVSLPSPSDYCKNKNTTIQLEPRVLFVVGADPTDPIIRPGAEYLGLLRRLEAEGLSFSSRILLNATHERLEKEMVSFRPSIVHFICHGLIEGARGYLELMPDERDQTSRKKYFAESLRELLSPTINDGVRLPPPPVVVLNACYTANNSPIAQVAAPLAVELVRGGVPVVVGMTGPVADQACRLFTRRFYDALLKGESVVGATAQGRWVAFVEGGSDPNNSVDWAFPTLFIAKGCCPQLTLKDRDRFTKLQGIARNYLNIQNPRAFCGRWHIVEDAYRELISSTENSGPRVLAVEVSDPDQASEEPRYGKTRLLQELAAKAIRDSHVPCLVGLKEIPINSITDFGREVIEAIKDTRYYFGLSEGVVYEFEKLTVQDADPNPKDVSVALGKDLLALAKDVSPLGRDLSNLKVLLLIDDVHRMGQVAHDLLTYLLVHNRNGLVRAADSLRVVFTFSSGPALRYTTAIKALTNFLDERRPYVEHIPLKSFPEPNKNPLPYQEFLMGRQQPLFLKLKDQKTINQMFCRLHERSFNGAPSGLKNQRVKDFIDSAILFNALVEGDDEKVLQKASEWKRGRGPIL